MVLEVWTLKPHAAEAAAVETRRLTANEIFDAAIDNARSELRRSSRKLAFCNA